MRFFPPTTSNNLKGTGLVFYCKDCEKVVDVIPVGRKFVYKCAICKTKNVAFGTEKSIRNFFHVEESAAPTVAAAAAVAPAAEKTAPVQAVNPPPPAPKTISASNQPAQQVPQKPDGGPTPVPENK